MSQMNRTITFFNMCFGDSFLIEDETNNLLIDCGSLNQGSTRKAFMSKLISKELNKFDVKNLLVTHYHADHFNTLYELFLYGVTFKNVYVRDLSLCGLTFDFSTAYASLAMYAAITGDHESFRIWLSFKTFRSLLASGSTVYGVNNTVRNKINIGKTVANVLWPGPLDEDEKLKKEVQNIGNQLFQCICYDKTNPVVKCLLKIHNYFSILLKKAKDGVITSFDIDEVQESYKDETIPSLDEVATYLKKMSISDSLSKAISDLENRLSIVFEIESKLLMCGDADDYALDRAMIKHKRNHGGKIRNFDLIKVPHHGTEPYYYPSLPCHDNTIYLIPNSQLKKGRNYRIYDKWVYGHPGIKYCFSLNNSASSACPAARSGACRFCRTGILDYLRFLF